LKRQLAAQNRLVTEKRGNSKNYVVKRSIPGRGRVSVVAIKGQLSEVGPAR
jgi:hypothetical protein